MNPAFLDEMSWAMSEVYAAVTDRILINLAHYFPYIKPGQKIPGSFEYQARMLAQMGQVNKETVEIIAKSLAGADEALQGVLTAAITEALKTEEPKLRRAAEKGLLQGGGFLPPEVAPNQMQAFRYYYRQSADKLNLVNTVMLESTQAAYSATVADIAAKTAATQSILNTAAGEVVTGVSTWNQAVKTSVSKMVQNGLTGFVDHGGHHWSPEAYVAMDVRTTTFNTAREAVFERNEDYGNDLYQVSSHNGARPLCYPWQGKVISRTDWVREVTDLDGETVTVYAQSETSYGEAAGLFGVNCRHYPMAFIPGFSTLKGEPQSPEENEKTYAESQEQRRLERKLREEKRDLDVMKAQGAPEEQIKAQRERVKAASQDIDDFCDSTGRTRRRNREGAPVRATWPTESGQVTRYNGGYIGTDQTPPPKRMQTTKGSSPVQPGQLGQPQQQHSKSYTLNDATKTTETVTINKGSSSELLLTDAEVYTTPDGTRFIFKSGMDAAHQKATPKFAIDQWYKTPQEIRAMAQKEVAFVDVYNPDDAYWKQTYTNFTQSYATGGDQIVFWRCDYDHDPAYFTRSLNHEMAHEVDTVLGGGTRYSLSSAWQKAMSDDLAASGKASITTYGENSPVEDFAESVAEYVIDAKSFLQIMPNRGNIIKSMIMKGGSVP